jgi:hypothetical protein
MEESIPIFTIDSFSIIHNIIEGEAVVMNLDTGLYYSLNPAASVIWEKITESKFSDASIREFAGPQNQHFIEFLIDHRLVSLGSATLPGVEAEAQPSAMSGIAEWQSFSDMKELLLLDPVHDIALSEPGWPEAPGNQKEI